MKENLGSAEVHLNDEDMKELELEFSKVKVFGKRAPEALMEAHVIGVNIGKSSIGGHGKSPLQSDK